MLFCYFNKGAQFFFFQFLLAILEEEAFQRGLFLKEKNAAEKANLWQAILLFIMQNRYLIYYIRYLI